MKGTRSGWMLLKDGSQAQLQYLKNEGSTFEIYSQNIKSSI